MLELPTANLRRENLQLYFILFLNNVAHPKEKKLKDIIKSRIKEHCYFGENFPKLGVKISLYLETSQKQSYLNNGDIEVEEEDGAYHDQEEILLVYL